MFISPKILRFQNERSFFDNNQTNRIISELKEDYMHTNLLYHIVDNVSINDIEYL